MRARFVGILGAGLFLSGLGYAGRFDVSDSSFGVSPFSYFVGSQGSPVCLSASGAVIGSGCAMSTEAFFANSVLEDVYDFEIDSAISNFTITISGSTSFIAENSPPPYSYGILVCPSQGTQCYSGMPDGLIGSATLVAPNEVTFDVTGAGQGLVFFVLEPVTLTDSSSPQPTVTASITSNSSTPEPGTLGAVGVALIGLAAWKRRRLAKLL